MASTTRTTATSSPGRAVEAGGRREVHDPVVGVAPHELPRAAAGPLQQDLGRLPHPGPVGRQGEVALEGAAAPRAGPGPPRPAPSRGARPRASPAAAEYLKLNTRPRTRPRAPAPACRGSRRRSRPGKATIRSVVRATSGRAPRSRSTSRRKSSRVWRRRMALEDAVGPALERQVDVGAEVLELAVGADQVVRRRRSGAGSCSGCGPGRGSPPAAARASRRAPRSARGGRRGGRRRSPSARGA